MAYLRRANLLLIVYVIVVFTTLASFFVIWGGFVFTASFWISLASILLAETALWRYCDYVVRHLDQVRRMVPGYLLLGIVISAYFVLVVFYALFTGFADFALPLYFLLHLVTFAAAVILGIIAVVFIRAAGKHEQDIGFQTATLREMEIGLKQLQGTIGMIGGSGKEQLEQAIAELIEKVRYSDPVAPALLAHEDRLLLEEIKLLNEEVSLKSGDENQDHSWEPITQRVRLLMQKLDLRNERVLAMKS